MLFFYGLRAKRKKREESDNESHLRADNERTDTEEDGKDYSNGFNYNSYRNAERDLKEDEKERIFVCPAPSCSQQIRLHIPPPKGIGRCSRCNSRFRIQTDKPGNLYIYSVEHISQDPGSFDLDISSCLRILEVNQDTSSDDIKAAYRKRMFEYHPDKVAKLGKELRVLAERKAKQINAAYDILKNDGYVS